MDKKPVFVCLFVVYLTTLFQYLRLYSVDKKPVIFISTFHDATTVSTFKLGKEIRKPKCIEDYNKSMEGTDLKDQKLQPYAVERKRCTKWCVKVFRRLLNTSVHNSFIVCSASEGMKKLDHLMYRLELVKELLELHGKALDSSCPGRPSKTPPPDRLTARHFIERIKKKAKPTKGCAVCCKKTGGRKETSFWCKYCEVGLCLENCFRVYHTEANFLRKQGRIFYVLFSIQGKISLLYVQ
jgi:hypothetical protein